MEWYSEESTVFEFPGGEQLRITVGACSEYDIATYGAHLAKAQAYMTETHGVDFAKLATGEGSFGDHWRLWSSLRDWAASLAGLRKLERRSGPDGEWKEMATPDAWLDPAQALRAIPAVVFRGWNGLVDSLNPGLFGVATDDTSKKSVRQIASESTN